MLSTSEKPGHLSRRPSASALVVRSRPFAFFLIFLPLLLGGCDRYPRDPNDSLERALERDTLHIGVAGNPPWVVLDSAAVPGGAEGVLLREFADQLGVAVQWHRGGAQPLLEALGRFELDIVAAGLTASNPWGRHVGFTLPYHTTRAIVGARDDHPASLEEVTVTIPPRSGLAEPLEERGARIRFTEDLSTAPGLIAGESWKVLATGRQWIFEDLGETRHVMAVPPGENALLMRLEGFLREHGDSARVVSLLQEFDLP